MTDVCGTTDNISFHSNGKFIEKKMNFIISFLIIINHQNSGDANQKRKKKSLVKALSRLGQKCYIIGKVNHPAHLISLKLSSNGKI